MHRILLMTGSLGFVGSEFLRRYLKWDQKAHFILLVRRNHNESGQSRFNTLLPELFSEIEIRSLKIPQRLTILETNLADKYLGLPEKLFHTLQNQINEIFHFASSVRFDLPLNIARENNVLSTENLLNFAWGCKPLAHFHYLSTYATAYSPPIAFEVHPRLSRSFRNSYEQTKTESESLLLEKGKGLPITIYRPSIIGGDSRSGWIPKFDTFYIPFKLMVEKFSGLWTRIPFPKNGKLDIVTIDYVADALYVLTNQMREKRNTNIHFFHLTAGSKATPILPTLHLTAKEYLNRIQCNPMSTEIRTHMSFSEMNTKSLQTLFKMLPYAFDPCTYDNSQTLKMLEGTSIQPISMYDGYYPLLDYSVRTQWGKIKEARPSIGRNPLNYN